MASTLSVTRCTLDISEPNQFATLAVVDSFRVSFLGQISTRPVTGIRPPHRGVLEAARNPGEAPAQRSEPIAPQTGQPRPGPGPCDPRCRAVGVQKPTRSSPTRAVHAALGDRERQRGRGGACSLRLQPAPPRRPLCTYGGLVGAWSVPSGLFRGGPWRPTVRAQLSAEGMRPDLEHRIAALVARPIAEGLADRAIRLCHWGFSCL